MKALISPTEEILDKNGNVLGQRVAQVETDENVFEVAFPLFWIDCADNIEQDKFYFDSQNQTFTEVPPTPQPRPEPAPDQPTTSGTQAA